MPGGPIILRVSRLPDFLSFQIQDINPPACSTRIEGVTKMVWNRAIVWASINLNLVKVSDWIFGEEVMWIKAVKEEKMDHKKVVWQVLLCHHPTPHFSCVKCDQWCWGRGNQTESQNQTFQIDISFINTLCKDCHVQCIKLTKCVYGGNINLKCLIL